MKIEEVERNLPNGFHDALLQNIFIDYITHEAVFEMKIWTGDIDSEDKGLREACRKGRLRLSDLRYCIIETPDTKYPYSDTKLIIDAGTISSLKKPPSHRLPEVSEEVFVHWFFVRQWNAFIYIAAKDAYFDWLENAGP